MKKKLYLLPNVLGEVPHHEVFLPASVDKIVIQLDGLIAESEKGGRRYLSRFPHPKKTHEIPIAILNKHTKEEELDFLLEPILQGEKWGVISDGGLPCIADPGARLVKRAREHGITPQAFVGPSSIFLALMLSGFSGQEFTFHGYFPRSGSPSPRKRGVDIFIETPYRNEATLENLLSTLSPETYLAVAWDLTLPTQGIVVETVASWKKFPLPNLEKKPAVFLISGV